MKNLDVREAIASAGVRHWQVAEKLSMREDAFSRKLRHELRDDEKQRVLDAVAQLKKEVKP